MNIQEIRQKYPQYNNVDDETLAQGFYNKFYKDRLSFDDFKNRIGLQTERSTLQQIGDVSRGLRQGIEQGVTFGLIDEAVDLTGAGLEYLGRQAGDVLGVGQAKDFSDIYDKRRQRTLQDMQKIKELAPIASTIGEIGGAIGAGVAGAGTKVGMRLADFLAKGGNLSRIAKATGTGAVGGGVAGFGTGQGGFDKRLENAQTGALYGGLGGGAFESGARALSPVVDSAIKPLAKRAREFGINLRLDQVKPSRALRTAQKVSQSLPFSGVDAQEALQRTQWNKAVAKTIGVDDLTPESINKFVDSNSAKYDAVLNDTKINIFPEDLQQIFDQINYIKDNVSPIQFNKINKTLQNVLNDFKTGLDNVDFKAVSARKINGLKSDLMKISATSKGDTKNIISETADFVNDVLNRSLPENKQKLLMEANKEYRNYKTLEPLLEKATDGEINPTDLINRVGSSKFINASKKEVGQDDLVDLARIGKQFMPKLGGSDTFEKSAYTVGTGGVLTGATDLATGGALTGATLAGNRVLQALNQSQRIVDRAIKGSELNVPSGLSRGMAQAGVNNPQPSNRLELSVQATEPENPQQPYINQPKPQQLNTDNFAQSAEFLENKIKRPLNRQDLILASTIGDRNALKVIRNIEQGKGDQPITSILRKQAREYRGLFFRQDGNPLTIEEFYEGL